MEIKLLSCPLCLKPHFEGVDALRSSLINVATSQLSCPVCSESLLGLDKLTIHLFSHITNNLVESNAPIVELQNNSCGNDNINNVIDSPEVAPQVPQQEEPMDSKESVNQIQTTEESNCIYCDICNFCFNDETILEMHQKLLHQTAPDKTTGEYSYHCHLCSKKFKMKGSLMVHLRVAHYGFGHNNHDESNYRKLSETSEDKSSEINNHLDEGNQQSAAKTASNSNIQDNKQWECDVCSKLFTTKYFLKKHKRLHTGEMPYFCAQCNKSFTFQQSYHKHMLYHSADKPHVCSECGRAFKELSTLHNHERIHSGERPFSCETCGKSFRQRVSYLVHRRIHTGVMPYKCPTCDKSFRYKVSQRSHKCPGNPQANNGDLPEKMDIPGETSTTLYSTAGYSIKLLDSINNLSQNGVENFENPNAYNFNLICTNVGQNFQIIDSNTKSQTEILQNNGENDTKSRNILGENLFTSTNQDGGNSSCQILDDGVALNENQFPLNYVNDSNNSDFFSMALSPLLPEVQSLCLNSSGSEAIENKAPQDKSPILKTINEESLKELLYGPNKNC